MYVLCFYASVARTKLNYRNTCKPPASPQVTRRHNSHNLWAPDKLTQTNTTASCSQCSCAWCAFILHRWQGKIGNLLFMSWARQNTRRKVCCTYRTGSKPPPLTDSGHFHGGWTQSFRQTSMRVQNAGVRAKRDIAFLCVFPYCVFSRSLADIKSL